jgi:hypothetical protein
MPYNWPQSLHFALIWAKNRADGYKYSSIVDRANVGRTTFYLHYSSKDDLFMSCHEAIVSEFHFGSHYLLS